MAPETILSHLHRADGSATYTHNGYSIIGAVNGPLEVARKDEIAEEATIEVNVRPVIGVGTPKERHLETLLYNTLRSIILVRNIPRTLVQITLQVRSLPEIENERPSLAILPHLLHTSLLALLSASIPLATILTSTIITLPKSIHVFAFSGERKMLLNESDGVFSYEEWDDAYEQAEEICCADSGEGGGVGLTEGMNVDGHEGDNLEAWLRTVVRNKVAHEQRWKVAG